MRSLLIRAAQVEGRPGLDVRLRAGRIVDVSPGLAPLPGEQIVEARGGALIPGLHDHHVHLHSAAAARASLDLSSLADPADIETALTQAHQRLPPGRVLRAIGLDGPAAQSWDRTRLDQLAPGRPVRVQDRRGALWVLSSEAVRSLDVASWTDDGVERTDGVPNGRLWRLDHRLRGPTAGPGSDPFPGGHDDELAALSAEACDLGITGFTDATPDRTEPDVHGFVELVRRGRIRQRLTLMAHPDLRLAASGGVRLGPYKVLLDDAQLPRPDELAMTIRDLHARGARVAVHCVTAEQLVVTLSAFSSAGVLEGDRVEHASVVPPGLATAVAHAGLTVVTQPGFIAARGDAYLRDVERAEQDWLYPCRTLQEAGVALAGSSDAPFGPLDPWLAIRTAVTRRAASGRRVAADEAIGAWAALDLFLGEPASPARLRRVAPGQPGDLCLLRGSLRAVLAEPDRAQVRATIIDEELLWSSHSS